MIRVESRGDFTKTINFLKQPFKNTRSILAKYGQIGVDNLAEATPKNSGATAASWYYIIKKESNGYSLNFMNSNENNGVNIAIILQYGHGTGWGGYVRGVDYINPVLKKLFEDMSDDLAKEVSSQCL